MRYYTLFAPLLAMLLASSALAQNAGAKGASAGSVSAGSTSTGSAGTSAGAQSTGSQGTASQHFSISPIHNNKAGFVNGGGGDEPRTLPASASSPAAKTNTDSPEAPNPPLPTSTDAETAPNDAAAPVAPPQTTQKDWTKMDAAQLQQVLALDDGKYTLREKKLMRARLKALLANPQSQTNGAAATTDTSQMPSGNTGAADNAATEQQPELTAREKIYQSIRNRRAGNY